MQLVIDVPDKVYEMVMNTGTYGCYRFNSTKAIREGTPLPTGHGSLKDADALCNYFWDNRSKLYTYKDLQIAIDSAETIIEADKAEMEQRKGEE